MILPTKAQARQDLDPFGSLFRGVVVDGWHRAIAEGPAFISTTTRKNMAWDAMCELVRERAPQVGLTISYLRRGRRVPLVLVYGDRFDYAIRFNCLSAELHAGGIHTDQRQMYEAQVETAPMLPGFKPIVNLRMGYVLDTFDLAIVRTPMVLSVDDSVVWDFDIDAPEEGFGGVGSVIRPPQPKTGGSNIRSIEAARERRQQSADDDGT